MTQTAQHHTWTFPRVPITLNRLVKGHWRVKHGERVRWGKEVLAIPKGPWHKDDWRRHWSPAHHRARLRITMHRWSLQDPGNREGSVKPLVDALVSRGWLMDDSDKWLELEVREEVERKRQRTEVEWSVLDD